MSQSKLTVEHYSLLLLDLKKHIRILHANGTWCQKTYVVRIHNMIHALFINKVTRFTHSKILR